MNSRILHTTIDRETSIEVSSDGKTVAIFTQLREQEFPTKIMEMPISFLWDLLRDNLSVINADEDFVLVRRKSEALAAMLHTTDILMRDKL